MKTIIGLESHMYLATEKKLYCECPASLENKKPNTNICPICTSQPGSKPMGVNKKAVEKLIQIGLMLDCKIITDKAIMVKRKHYFYPDLPSNYQRTSDPIAIEGRLGNVRIREIHFEEDPGRYELRKGLVDYDRSGMPLIELVTEPDLSTPQEAREFLTRLSNIIDYIGALNPNLAIKTDANISLQGHNRVEVKNINSFKGVQKALGFEIQRQKNMIQRKTAIKQETRHYDETQMITRTLREKETAEDYRYIPDPDLPPIIISKQWVESLEKSLPESPEKKALRLAKKYKISQKDAEIITSEKSLAECFEKVAEKTNPVLAAKWFRGEVKRQLNYRGILFRESKLNTQNLAQLLQLLEQGKTTQLVAKKILEKIIDTGESPKELIEKQDLSPTSRLEKTVEEVLKENKKAVQDYLKGETNAINYLLGKIMQKTKGTADPDAANNVLKKKIGEQK